VLAFRFGGLELARRDLSREEDVELGVRPGCLLWHQQVHVDAAQDAEDEKTEPRPDVPANASGTGRIEHVQWDRGRNQSDDGATDRAERSGLGAKVLRAGLACRSTLAAPGPIIGAAMKSETKSVSMTPAA
jgi:hypothetical protein